MLIHFCDFEMKHANIYQEKRQGHNDKNFRRRY